MPDLTLETVQAYANHAASGDILYGAESRIIQALVKKESQVLDIGCGTGRVTRALARTGARVDACDLDEVALEELRQSKGDLVVHARLADVRNLPYPDCQFDVVIFSFNGLDFLRPMQERFIAIAEMNRVLKPGGHLVISSHNPVGSLLSPRGIFRIDSLKNRFCRLLKGNVMSDYAADLSGITLYQGTPKRIIAEIERESGMRNEFCSNRTGHIRSKFLNTLFSPWPYYVFAK